MLHRRLNLCFQDNVTKAVTAFMFGDLGIKLTSKEKKKDDILKMILKREILELCTECLLWNE